MCFVWMNLGCSDKEIKSTFPLLSYFIQMSENLARRSGLANESNLKRIYSRRKKKQAIFDEDQQKHQKYSKMQQEKRCLVCYLNDKETRQFLFCDQCDDAYHWDCLSPPILQEPDDEWICSICQELKHVEQEEERERLKIRAMSKDCSKCKLQLKTPTFIEVEVFNKKHQQWVQMTVQYLPESLNSQQCNHCDSWFHLRCFNSRQNSLNCSECEAKIRKNGPKSHKEWKQWISGNSSAIKEFGYIKLESLPVRQNQPQRSQIIGLRVFQEPGDWELITKAQMSFYYAMQTRKLHYCPSQLYKSHQIMALNDSQNHFQRVLPLSSKDEQAFEQFLSLTGVHQVGCLEVRESRKIGFYVVATRFIEKYTILCEYAGEVCTRRQSKIHNDSIFSLLINQFAHTSLDIMPEKFSNIARFMSGLHKTQKGMQNVKSLKFSFRGRNRILFYACRPIERNSTLFLDYNDGVFEEFPTEGFVTELDQGYNL